MQIVSLKPVPEAEGDSDDSEDNASAEDVQLPAKIVPAQKTVAVPKPAVKPSPTVVASATTTGTLVAPAPPPVIISGNKWGIQIGAYGDPEVGREALANLAQSMPQLLGNADPVIQKVSSGTVTMFRARLMSLDEKTATAACAYLNQHGQSCLTVGP